MDEHLILRLLLTIVDLVDVGQIDARGAEVVAEARERVKELE